MTRRYNTRRRGSAWLSPSMPVNNDSDLRLGLGDLDRTRISAAERIGWRGAGSGGAVLLQRPHGKAPEPHAVLADPGPLRVRARRELEHVRCRDPPPARQPRRPRRLPRPRLGALHDAQHHARGSGAGAGRGAPGRAGQAASRPHSTAAHARAVTPLVWTAVRLRKSPSRTMAQHLESVRLSTVLIRESGPAGELGPVPPRAMACQSTCGTHSGASSSGSGPAGGLGPGSPFLPAGLRVSYAKAENRKAARAHPHTPCCQCRLGSFRFRPSAFRPCHRGRESQGVRAEAGLTSQAPIQAA
jgi:hypothetical protein